jgi:hypothetical protein
MLTRFISFLVLVASQALVSALTINTPTGVTSGGTFNLSWVTAPGDPTSCTFELISALDLGLANAGLTLIDDVNLSLGFIIAQCPSTVIPDDYAIQAFTNEINIETSAIAQSATFSINAIAVSATGTLANTNTPTSTANSLPVTSSTSHSSNSSLNVIIGGVIGGLVFILLLLALFFCNRNRRRNNQIKGRTHALSEYLLLMS